MTRFMQRCSQKLFMITMWNFQDLETMGWSYLKNDWEFVQHFWSIFEVLNGDIYLGNLILKTGQKTCLLLAKRSHSVFSVFFLLIVLYHIIVTLMYCHWSPMSLYQVVVTCYHTIVILISYHCNTCIDIRSL